MYFGDEPIHDEYDEDYDVNSFADEELCSNCGQPFYYVGHSIDDICLECDGSISEN